MYDMYEEGFLSIYTQIWVHYCGYWYQTSFRVIHAIRTMTKRVKYYNKSRNSANFISEVCMQRDYNKGLTFGRLAVSPWLWTWVWSAIGMLTSVSSLTSQAGTLEVIVISWKQKNNFQWWEVTLYTALTKLFIKITVYEFPSSNSLHVLLGSFSYSNHPKKYYYTSEDIWKYVLYDWGLKHRKVCCIDSFSMYIYLANFKVCMKRDFVHLHTNLCPLLWVLISNKLQSDPCHKDHD